MGRKRHRSAPKMPAAPPAPAVKQTRSRGRHVAVVASLGSQGFEAAGSGPRLSAWTGSGAGVNSLIASSGGILRARSRDLARNNPIAKTLSDRWVSNLVGTGIEPHSEADDKEFRDAIEDAWEISRYEFDPLRSMDIYGIMAQVARAVFEGGECLARFRNRLPSDGLFVPLQVQLMEPEQLDAGRDAISLPGGRRISRGIEFDEIGAPVAYWLHRNHPGENTGQTIFRESVRVPASEIMHVYQPLRPGQIGGLPALSSLLVRLRDLDEYDDAELVRKKGAALILGFITKLDAAGPLPGDDGGTNGIADSGDPDVGIEGMEPGSMMSLNPGEDVKFSEPADVGGNYESFQQSTLRKIAAAAGFMYEQLTGDYRGATYSSLRQGLLEFRRSMEQLQKLMMIVQFCRPLWRRWVRTAVLSGAVQVRGGAAAFARNPESYMKANWVPQSWQWIDPLKEVMADLKALEARLISRQQLVAARYGRDIDEVDAEIAADPHHPKPAASTPAKPQAPPAQEREEDEEDEEDEDAEAV